MDAVARAVLVGEGSTKCLTGIDDHSRYCVCAQLMPAERTEPSRRLRRGWCTSR